MIPRGTACVALAGIVLACGSPEPVRPRQPDAAALAVVSSGDCRVGRGGVVAAVPSLAIDAPASGFGVHYEPFEECGGRKAVDYVAAFGAGRVRVEGRGSVTEARTGITWRVVSESGAKVQFVAAVGVGSDADAGDGGVDVGKVSADGRELETLLSVDDANRSRSFVLRFVVDDDATYLCSFRLRWREASGEYVPCTSAGCGSGHVGDEGIGDHDFED